MGTANLKAIEIEQATPQTTWGVVRGITELLTEHRMPARLTLVAVKPPMQRDGVPFRSFDARFMGVNDIYRVTASLLGSAVVNGRPTVNGIDCLIAVGTDRHLEPEDIIRLTRNIGGSSPPEMREPDPILRGLGSSILDLSAGRNTFPGEFWDITPRT